MKQSGAANRRLDDGRSVEAGKLAAGLRRRWRWVFWPTLCAALGSCAFVMVATPRYTGAAKVMLEDQESYSSRSDKAPGFEQASPIDPGTVQSQAEAASSADLARKSVEELGLASNGEFNSRNADSAGGGIDQRIVDKFLSRLTVFPVPRSDVLQFEFVSRDPELAARGANTAAQVFVQSRTDAKALAARTAVASLSHKIEELRGNVADADAKVKALRAELGLLAGENGQTVSGQQLYDLNAQLTTARAAKSRPKRRSSSCANSSRTVGSKKRLPPSRTTRSAACRTNARTSKRKLPRLPELFFPCIRA